MLLLHGTGDRVLNCYCSLSLHDLYGEDGDRTLKLFDDNDHALTQHPHEAEELLCEFIAKCVGAEIASDEQRDVIKKVLTRDENRIDLVRKGGNPEQERNER